MRLQTLAAGLLAFTTSVFAAPAEELIERDSVCTNGPNTRSCWKNGYSIATDFDQKHPSTGNTVSYTLTVTNTTCSPDGNGPQQCLLINGQFPGPTITADWGDMLSITVVNNMQDNGTAFHWHGVRQLNTNDMDGVNGVTECPIAPGDSRTYLFQATQFGSSWYHSHFSSQYGMGTVGNLVFNGPATSNYDIDLGPFPLTDWYYQSAFQIADLTLNDLQQGQPGPPGDNVLINGTGKNNNGGGSYSQTTVTPGKRYRLRLINTSVDNAIRVSLDNHPFTVMTTDFVPVNPYVTQWVLLGIGQRYDVVFTANQTSSNYWFRAVTAGDCLSANNANQGGVVGQQLAIFSYSNITAGTPTSSQFTIPSVCADPTPSPYWKQAVPSTTAFTDLDVNLVPAAGIASSDTLVYWGINQTTMDVIWDTPLLQYAVSGNTSYPSGDNVISLPTENQWTYWVIQEVGQTPQIPHPIHLHGHDFFVLGAQASATFSSSSVSSLNFATPTRRDVAILPAGGWLAIAFETNNPGAWLMHCHIAWHVGEGLAVNFLESASTIPQPGSAWQTTCANWSKYEKTMYWKKNDSGL